MSIGKEFSERIPWRNIQGYLILGLVTFIVAFLLCWHAVFASIFFSLLICVVLTSRKWASKMAKIRILRVSLLKILVLILFILPLPMTQMLWRIQIAPEEPTPKEINLIPSKAYAFGGVEPFEDDVTDQVGKTGDDFAPKTYWNKSGRFFVSGREYYFGALSICINVTDIRNTDYTATLRICTRRGNYDDSGFHHYMIQIPRAKAGKYFQNRANDGKPYYEAMPSSEVHSLGEEKTFHWLDVPLSDEQWIGGQWVENKFWIQVRIWNAAVDAVILRLDRVAVSLPPLPQLVFEMQGPVLGSLFFLGMALMYLIDPTHTFSKIGKLPSFEGTLFGFIIGVFERISEAIILVAATGLVLRTLFNWMLLDEFLYYHPEKILEQIDKSFLLSVLRIIPWYVLQKENIGAIAVFYAFISFLAGLYSYSIMALLAEGSRTS